MAGLVAVIEHWTVWQWYLAWLLFWATMLFAVNVRKASIIFKDIENSGALKNYPKNAVFPAFLKALSQDVVTPFFVAVIRFHLLFVSFWAAYFLVDSLSFSGVIKWTGAVTLFFVIVFCLMKVLGHVGSKDTSGKRLTKEFILGVVGFIFLFLSLL